MTLAKFCQDDAATAGFDDLASTHIMRPIMALDENMRENRFDESARFVFVEDDDAVNGAESREDNGAIHLVVDRPSGAFIAEHRGIAIQSNNQRVTLSTRKFQILDVAPMQDVEASVREDKFAAGCVQSVTQLSRRCGGKYFAIHHCFVPVS